MAALTGPGAFRFILALTVVAYHLSRFAIGASAVYVFFVLSGFWIYKMWTLKYVETAQPYITYLISRLWRLLPVFWLCGALALILEPWAGAGGSSELHYWGSQFWILGYNSLTFRPNIPAWSLDVEMRFYVVAPLLALWIARSGAVAPLLTIGVVAILASLLVGVGFLSCSMFFAIGISAAKWNWRPNKTWIGLSAGLLGLGIGGCLALPGLRSIMLVGAHPGPLSHLNAAAQVAIGFLTIPYAIWTTLQKSGRMDKILADASYSLYLLHWPLLKWVIHHPMQLSRVIVLGCLFVACVLLSLLVTMLFDAPIQKLRVRWVSGRKRVSASIRSTPPVASLSPQQ